MKSYLRVTFTYMVFGVLWILASDRLVELVAGDLQDLAYFQTLKGITFVLLSALLICILTRRALPKLKEQQEEKDAVFRKTVEGSHHILLNYLNNMQLVTMEAAFCSLALKDGFIPGNAHLQHPDEACAGLDLPRTTLDEKPGIVLSTSSGFGGSNVALIFREA
jgi:hypothetical protein